MKKLNEDSAVIEPRSYRTDPKVRDPVILCPPGPLLKMAARFLNAKKATRRMEPASIYTVKKGGRKVTLAGPCMGAPAAVFLLERLIAHGARNFLMLGLAGSIRNRVKIGDLVVPDWAIIDEGTSSNYVNGAKRSASGELALKAVSSAVEGMGKSYHKGLVWTTDAVFRETVGKVKAMSNQDALAVEMEASALFTVARYREVEMGALLVVSDELSDFGWKQGFTRRRFLSACRHASHIAMRTAFLMKGWDPDGAAPPEEFEHEEEIPEEED